MSNLENRIKSSVISGIIEVFTTHPLDYAKTLIQNKNKNITLDQFLKNPYKGVSSRLIGVIPMRVLFWNSITYFKENGYNPISSGILTASIQTIVDYPIEQIKIQKMINNSSVKNAFINSNIYKGFSITLCRNIGFAVILNKVIDKKDGSYYHGAIGGFAGAVLTHPLDSLKTWYQSNNNNYPTHWTYKDYYKGWYFRAGISLISMNVGWLVYSTLQNYYKQK